MAEKQPSLNPIPLNMVGGSTFGRYPKISDETTCNMMVSDGWLVPYPGYKKVAQFGEDGAGRGMFHSVNNKTIITVIGQSVYTVDKTLAVTLVGSLDTTNGDVFISENIGSQIAICDKKNIYIWDYSTLAFEKISIDITPGYLDFQNGRFIIAAVGLPKWRLSISGLLGIGTPTIVNGGTGYTAGDILDLKGGKNGKIKVLTVDAGVIKTVEVNVEGSGYSSSGEKEVAGGTGNGAKFTITLNNGFPASPSNVGTLQSKPDNCQACVRFPGKGNLLLVMGNTVTEFWQDIGAPSFPYQRSSSINIDYGCLSVNSIAEGGEFVIWLAGNEKFGASIMLTTGGDTKQISTDGINFLLSRIRNPSNSYAFLYKESGHIFYQITFPDKNDDLTLVYDITEDKFFNLCDKNMSCHIAKKIVFYNGKHYFISFNDNNLYEMDGEITTYDGDEIPRIRISKSIRLDKGEAFIANNASFIMEQGESSDISRVDLRLSRNGGAHYGNDVHYNMNPLGKRRNKVVFSRLGYANELILQFRFWGYGRFVIYDGAVEIYK